MIRGGIVDAWSYVTVVGEAGSIQGPSPPRAGRPGWICLIAAGVDPVWLFLPVAEALSARLMPS